MIPYDIKMLTFISTILICPHNYRGISGSQTVAPIGFQHIPGIPILLHQHALSITIHGIYFLEPSSRPHKLKSEEFQFTRLAFQQNSISGKCLHSWKNTHTILSKAKTRVQRVMYLLHGLLRKLLVGIYKGLVDD